MLTDLFMGLGLLISKGFFALLPPVTIQLPADKMTGFMTFFWSVNRWLPVSELGDIIKMIIALTVALHGFKFVRWCWDSVLAVIP